MSVGGFIGAVVGGVVGFFVGGPMGAVMGAGIGAGLGMVVDPIRPDIPTPGEPQLADLSIPTAQEGAVVADLLGTSMLAGNILFYENSRTEEITQEAESGGKGGGGSQTVVTGYTYYLSWLVGLCLGPVDALLAVWNGDECVWHGEIVKENGTQTITLSGIGQMIFSFGTEDQTAPAGLPAALSDPTLSPAYRRFCYAWFPDGCLGNQNRVPPLRFVIQKRPVLSFSPAEAENPFGYGAAHALWYVLHSLRGLPEDFLNAESFAAAAQTLADEGRSVSLLMDRQQDALAWATSLLTHMAGVLTHGSDGKLHLSLMRADKEIWDLPQITQHQLRDLTFERPSWHGTINDVKVQYPQLYLSEFGVGGQQIITADACEGVEAPTLELVVCGTDKEMFTRRVWEISQDGLTLNINYDLTTTQIAFEGASLVHGGEQRTILFWDAFGNYTIDSAFSDIQVGDSIIMVLDLGENKGPECRWMGAWSVLGGFRDPDLFNLTVRYVDDGGIDERRVRKNFVYECKPKACRATEAKVQDLCRRDSAWVGMSQKCSCGEARFDDATIAMSCGQEKEFSITGQGKCCNLSFVLRGPGHIQTIKEGKVLYQAPAIARDGSCCAKAATLTARCCDATLGTVTIGFPCKCDEAAIGYTTLTMRIGETQNLQVVPLNTACRYGWELVGAGELVVAYHGRTAQYTAPASNENCQHEPVINLFCCGDMVDSITVSITSNNTYSPAYIRKTLVACWKVQYMGSCGTRCQMCGESFTCDGSLLCSSTMSEGSNFTCCWAGADGPPDNPCINYQLQCDTCGESGGSAGHCSAIIHGNPLGEFVDVRSPALIAQGCCPNKATMAEAATC